jgi:hypothetical protein
MTRNGDHGMTSIAPSSRAIGDRSCGRFFQNEEFLLGVDAVLMKNSPGLQSRVHSGRSTGGLPIG